MRSFFIGEINPLPLALAEASNPDGKWPNGRTKVWTVQGRCSGGVVPSMITKKQLEWRHHGFIRCLTITPCPSSYTNYLPFIFSMVDNSTYAETHNVQRWCFFWCIFIRVWHRVKILWIFDDDFKLAPRNLWKTISQKRCYIWEESVLQRCRFVDSESESSKDP